MCINLNLLTGVLFLFASLIFGLAGFNVGENHLLLLFKQLNFNLQYVPLLNQFLFCFAISAAGFYFIEYLKPYINCKRKDKGAKNG
jgi:hypothetical protein